MMNTNLYRSLVWALLFAFSLVSLAGCHSAPSGSKDDELNSAMSEQQKASIRQHKRNAGD